MRIAETDAGMLNSIGLANPGIERFLADKLPRLPSSACRSGSRSAGSPRRDYAEICAALDDRRSDDDRAQPVVPERRRGARERRGDRRRCAPGTSKPLYAKLSPAATDFPEAARAVQAAGADGLSLVNTIRGLALDERTLEPRLGHELGGYSGPALKPIALAAVYQCYRATGLPIVGMGGVSTGRDALEFLAAGAGAVALGTVLFSDPEAPGRVRGNWPRSSPREASRGPLTRPASRTRDGTVTVA